MHPARQENWATSAAPMDASFDLVVLGAGSGGLAAAKRAAEGKEARAAEAEATSEQREDDPWSNLWGLAQDGLDGLLGGGTPAGGGQNNNRNNNNNNDNNYIQ